MYLTHLTRNIENIKSILIDGFIFVPNPTKIWDELFLEINEKIPDVPNGMISFTEIPEDISSFQNSFMQNNFGKYGITVDFNWALDNGLRKVAYIDKNSNVFDALKLLLKESFPKNNLVHDFIPQFEIDRLHKMFINNPNNPSFTNNSPLFSLLVNLLQFVETSAHSKEIEYRIKSTKSPNFSENHSSKEIVNLSKNDLFENSLKLAPDNILFLICPKKEIDNFLKEIQKTQYPKIKVVAY